MKVFLFVECVINIYFQSFKYTLALSSPYNLHNAFWFLQEISLLAESLQNIIKYSFCPNNM